MTAHLYLAPAAAGKTEYVLNLVGSGSFQGQHLSEPALHDGANADLMPQREAGLLPCRRAV
jgi:hypothetical protein